MPESTEAPPAGATADTTPIKAVPVRHYGRWAAGVITLFIAFIVIRSVATNEALHWPVAFDYLFDDRILRGLQNTLILTVLSMLIGIFGGILLAVMRLSPNPLTSGAAAIYIWLFRGTPLITQLIIWNFLGLAYSKIGLGIPFGPTFFSWDTNTLINQFTASLLGLGLNEAAYMAEIVRGGVQSIDAGQLEAASALGMSRPKTLRRIVLPQAMRVIIPPTGNETISMLKTTALVTVIGYFDLMQQVRTIYSQNYQTVPLLIAAALWYLFMTSVLTVIQFFIEKYFARGGSHSTTRRTGRLFRTGRGGGNVT